MQAAVLHEDSCHSGWTGLYGTAQYADYVTDAHPQMFFILLYFFYFGL